MLAPDTNTEPVVDIWTGTSLEIDELVMGANVVVAKVRAIKEAQAARAAMTVKVAADECAVICGQMQSLSAHLARVLAKHAARESKVRT